MNYQAYVTNQPPFNDHFLAERGMPINFLPLFHVPKDNLWGLIAQMRCLSYHPTNNVKALKETRSTDPNHCTSLILLTLSTTTVTTLLMDGCLLLLLHQCLSKEPLGIEIHFLVKTLFEKYVITASK